MDRGRTVLRMSPQPGVPRNSEGAFCRLKDNSILFVYGMYHGNSAGDLAPCNIVARHSFDEGETWTEPKEILKASDFGVINIGSITLIRLLDGDLGMLFSRPQPNQGWIRHKFFTRSSDEGKTFHSMVECSSELYDCRSGVNNARLIRLSSGRLIYPHSIHPGCFKPHEEGKRKPSPTSHTQGNFIYSDDDGYTWKTSTDTIYMPFTGTCGLQEGEIIEIAPNVLKCFFRTQMAYQYESLSFDGGDHWTLATPSCFTGPCSPITVRKNPYSGKTYALWNPIPVYNGRKEHLHTARTPLAIAETDESVSKILKLEYVFTNPNMAYCYMAPMFLNEKELLLSYNNGDVGNGEKSMDSLAIAKVDLDF